jgi:hypothetical protein
MAKKRKVKVKKAKAMKRVVKATPIASTATAYTLSLAGGLVILIAGILAILGIKIGVGLAASVTGMATGIICGLVILLATAAIRKTPRLAGLAILVFSIIALVVPPSGLFFGPVLSLISAVILLIRR